MNKLISNTLAKLIKNLFFLVVLISCQSSESNDCQFQINGNSIKVRVAKTLEAQQKGVSGIKSENFLDTEAMLFYYPEEGERRFWMPETFFDLDIFFLDRNNKVIAIERDVPHYPGRSNPSNIPTTKTYISKNVLEMKASSPWSKKIQINDLLQFSATCFR